jgi:hypothetical protein
MKTCGVSETPQVFRGRTADNPDEYDGYDFFQGKIKKNCLENLILCIYYGKGVKSRAFTIKTNLIIRFLSSVGAEYL